jgi:multidrug efflux system membrane fusion protein
VAPTDTTPLVVINQMKPILVQFTVPQQMLEAVRRYQSRQSIKVFITHEDGGDPLGQGQLVFVDNAVNPDTGTVLLKARLPNDNEQLWPGQYVGVRMQLALQSDALVLPQTAIQTGQDGVFVYLVRDGIAQIQPVKVDRQVDDLAVIAAGLKPGDTVITHVPRNLRPGLPVETGAAASSARVPAARP